MNWRLDAMSVVLIAGFAALAVSDSRSGAGYAVSADVMDSGGQRVTNASCTMDGSLGGFGACVSNEGAQMRSGYVGQLTEVTNLMIAGAATVPEFGTNELGGVAAADDDTWFVLAGTDVLWSPPAFPIGAISPMGLATAANVYDDTPASVTGRYLGVTGFGVFLVLDRDTDDWGLYAGDNVPDGWQVLHFGTNSPSGLASATNSTGQNNLFCYIADLDPHDPANSFGITGIFNLPPHRVVSFCATSTARVYRLAYSTNLSNGVWTNLPGRDWTSGEAGLMSLMDTNATVDCFYRVQVSLPPR